METRRTGFTASFSFLALALAACATAEPPPVAPAPPPAPQESYEATTWRACDGGNLFSCQTLEGPGGGGDEALVTRAAEKACALGDGRSCTFLAYRVSTQDPARAEQLRWQACDSDGDLEACARLAQPAPGAAMPTGPHALAAASKLCERGPMPENDCEPLLVRLKDAPENELDPVVARLVCGATTGAECLERQGRFHVSEGVVRFGFARRPAYGLDLLARACAAGRDSACETREELLYENRVVKGRRDEAVELAKQACAAGGKESCFFLGEVQLAPGKHRDLTKAVATFTLACEESAECGRQAGVYLASRGHLREAQRLFELGCHDGAGESCEELGRLLVLRGQRGAEVESLLQGPCENGSRVACRALASISRGERARRYRELGREPEDSLSRDVRASYRRSWKGEGTTGDALFMAATVMTGGFPAIFAVPVPRPTGFGFARSDYPDP